MVLSINSFMSGHEKRTVLYYYAVNNGELVSTGLEGRGAGVGALV